MGGRGAPICAPHNVLIRCLRPPLQKRGWRGCRKRRGPRRGGQRPPCRPPRPLGRLSLRHSQLPPRPKLVLDDRCTWLPFQPRLLEGARPGAGGAAPAGAPRCPLPPGPRGPRPRRRSRVDENPWTRVRFSPWGGCDKHSASLSMLRMKMLRASPTLLLSRPELLSSDVSAAHNSSCAGVLSEIRWLRPLICSLKPTAKVFKSISKET